MKRILLSILTVGIVSVIAIGATRAYFSDLKSVAGNKISTGTIEIDLSSPGKDWGETEVINISDLMPGRCTNYAFQVKNNSTEEVKLRISMGRVNLKGFLQPAENTVAELKNPLKVKLTKISPAPTEDLWPELQVIENGTKWMDTLGKDQIAEYEFSACLHESFHIQKAENVLNFFLNVTAGQVDNSDF